LITLFTFKRRESVRRHTVELFEDNLPLVLCILGGAILTVPILGYGPLIAVILGLAVGTVVMDRLANWAT